MKGHPHVPPDVLLPPIHDEKFEVTMTLLKIYKNILLSIGLTIAEDQAIMLGDSPVYINTDDGKRQLFLPTKEVLVSGDWGAIAAFHPMCEYVYSGQSEVLNCLTELMALSMCDTVLRCAASIVAMAGKIEDHDKLRIQQKSLISKYEITKTLVSTMLTIATKHTGIGGKYPILSLRLDRSGVIGDDVFSRTASIIPHILLTPKDADGKDTFMGTAVSPKTALAIKDIIASCLPAKLKYGSNSVNTPYLFALLECYYAFANHINGLSQILGKYSTVKVIDTSWYEFLPELKKLQKAELPQVLPFNRGVTAVTEEKVTDTNNEDDDERVVDSTLESLEAAISSNTAPKTDYSSGLNKIGRRKPTVASDRDTDRQRSSSTRRPVDDEEPRTIAGRLAAAAYEESRGARRSGGRRYGPDDDYRDSRRRYRDDDDVVYTSNQRRRY